MMPKLLFGLLIAFLSMDAIAQDAIPPRPSPLAIASCRYKDTYLKITYSQPHKKGRAIFGALVPFDQVWRTGANEATEITITRDVFLNKQLVPAGSYTLFTIPQKDKWTIIINKDLGLWGSYNYNDKMDLLRFDVPTTSIEPPTVFEPFTIQVEQRNNQADLNILWDRTKVSISVEFIEPKP